MYAGICIRDFTLMGVKWWVKKGIQVNEKIRVDWVLSK